MLRRRRARRSSALFRFFARCLRIAVLVLGAAGPPPPPPPLPRRQTVELHQERPRQELPEP